MKIKSSGNVLVVTSELTKAQFEKAMTYNPDALKVVDADDNEVFKLSFNTEGEASLKTFGATFNGYDTESGKLTSTMMIGQFDDVDKKKDFIKKTYGNALASLAEAEVIVMAAITESVALVEDAFQSAEIE